MRPKFTTVAVIVVAVFAISAVGAAAASASLPEILNKEGKQLVKNKFTGTSSGLTYLEGQEGNIFQCNKAKGSGEVTGPTSGTFKIVYTECGTALGLCGVHDGEVTLSFTLTPVYLNGEKEHIGLLYSLPSAGTSFTCSDGVEVTLHGSYLTSAIRVNHLATEYNIGAKQTKGKQEYDKYENAAGEKKEASLEMSIGEGAPNKAGISTLIETKFEEEGQFKN